MKETEPNTQKPKTLKGSMKYFNDDCLEFTPFGQGTPVYTEVRKAGGGSLMRTTGEKQQSLVAHLKVDADTADPAADLRDEPEKCRKPCRNPMRSPVRGSIFELFGRAKSAS